MTAVASVRDAAAKRREFVRAHTRALAPPLCPEIVLHTADELTALWQAEQPALERLGVDTPFWAVPWAGGQALARFLLDHPRHCDHREALDLGCGGALVALAAARAGARRVLASDPDPLALAAAELNAALNGLEIETLAGDILDACPPASISLVLAADLWFEDALSQRVTRWLRAQARRGCDVLVGDPYRAYFPRRGTVLLAEYAVSTSTDIERHATTRAGVWRLCG